MGNGGVSILLEDLYRSWLLLFHTVSAVRYVTKWSKSGLYYQKFRIGSCPVGVGTLVSGLVGPRVYG